MNTPPQPGTPAPHRGLAGAIAAAFVDSPLTPLFVLVAVLLGGAAIALLPREEEPQIHVPMIDVHASVPGASAREVEERATRPVEGLLWEVPGVEYLYSTSREEESLVIVRFKVGSDPDTSLARVAEKLRAQLPRVAPNLAMPSIVPRSIDDVPILALTLHGPGTDHLQLRRLAVELEGAVKGVPDVAETAVIGGARRQVRIQLDPARLAAHNLTPSDLVAALRQANRQQRAGTLTVADREVVVDTGAFAADAAQLGDVVVASPGGRPVRVRDVAGVRDGQEEPSQYVFHGAGAGGPAAGPRGDEAAVTLTVAKRPGANAITVASEVLRRVDGLRGRVLPPGVAVTVARNYGTTAAEKSDELLLHMGIAVAGVAVLVWLALGWREAGVVGIAIPATLALTLLVFLLWGFTLNRITLFALIFSIGILVDDAIVVVENVVRHLRMPANAGRAVAAVAVEAVAEVGNPTILATFAVIAAVLPMAFVGGLMGPYMRPIPVGAGAAMFWSLLVAFVVTPWASVRMLGRMPHGRGGHGHGEAPEGAAREDWATRWYRVLMGRLVGQARWRWGFLLVTGLLLAASAAGVLVGWVKVKMLPFDNKSEFQVVLNMPEGSSLERTAQAVHAMAAELRTVPEVRDFQSYVGVAAPFGFNGLVRHYFLRRGANVADIQVNLVPGHDRRAQSHDVARRVRPALAAVAARFGARLAVAEVPPGPPVLQTLVAEVYAPDDATRMALATQVRDLFRRTRGVVDVDWYVEDDQPRFRLVVDTPKAAQHGVGADEVARTLRLALGSDAVDVLHGPAEREDVDVVVELPRGARGRPEDLLALRVRGREPGVSVPLRELVRVQEGVVERSRHRKNLLPVVYVVGDVAGEVESPVYAILEMNRALSALAVPAVPGHPASAGVRIHNASQPPTDASPAMKWDGEWHVTIEVFRDLGLAFAAVMVLIYVLMVGWFRSFLTPLVVMAAIPFSLVGILPVHGALGAFFTATSMIGFMAGAGIVVRNSIILVDFIEQRLAAGVPLATAVVDAGAVRFRPMVLTALAVVVGAAAIVTDPIFQGLALSLMAGEVASLMISRVAVPVLYYMVHRRTAA